MDKDKPSILDRARRLGVRVDFQDVLMWDKAATIERFLGRATADRAVPAKTLIERMGLDSLGAGTDFPTNTINPFINMYVMVTRKDQNAHVYGASEAISREQALRLYASAASRYTFDEGRKGTLEAGKLADLLVLSADFMTRFYKIKVKAADNTRMPAFSEDRLAALKNHPRPPWIS